MDNFIYYKNIIRAALEGKVWDCLYVVLVSLEDLYKHSCILTFSVSLIKHLNTKI